MNLINEFRSSYHPPRSILSQEFVNDLTRDLYNDMEDPNFDIYLYRLSEDKPVQIWYADNWIGVVEIDKDDIITDIKMIHGNEQKFKTFDQIRDKYIGYKFIYPKED